MKRALTICALSLIVGLAGVPAASAAGHRGLPLVHAGDLAYHGAFLLPKPVSDRKTFSYGGTALAYDPGRDGLFVVGHDWYQLTAEVSTPAPVRSQALPDLPRARFLQ